MIGGLETAQYAKLTQCYQLMQIANKSTNFYLVSRLGFNCLHIFDVSVVTKDSLRRPEWLETYKIAKRLRKNCSKVSTSVGSTNIYIKTTNKYQLK